MNISQAAAKYPVSVIMLYAALFLTGITSFFKLEISMFPDIRIPAAYIVTECLSLSADDIEKMITVPVENSLSSVRGIKDISSFSKEGLSSVKLIFGWNEDMLSVSGEIREKIDTVYPSLPFESEKPFLFFRELSESTVMTLSIVPSDNRTKSQISRIADTDLKSRLLAVEGVSEVRLSGLSEEEIKIDVDYPALVNTGLQLNAVINAVSSNIFSNPAGKAVKGNKEYRVRTETDVKSVSDIRNIALAGREGLLISDIAEVYSGEKESYSFFHSDGKKGIGIEIIKTGSSGLLNTARRIKRTIREVENIFINDFKIIIIDDSSQELKKTMAALIFTAAGGIISAFFVLTLFFRNIKTALIVIISLPLSLAAVFIYMFFTKISLNIISVTGLIIGTGMVFDNTIIVTEKLLSEKPDTAEKTGGKTAEALLSVAGSTLTTIIIFLPLSLISGISGKLFKDLASAVIAFITASAIVSITVPPALYMLLNKNNNFSKENKTPLLILKFKAGYKRYLSKEKQKLLPLLLVFTLPLFMIFIIDKEIIPAGYSKKLNIYAEFIPGISAEEYSAKSIIIENAFLDTEFAETIHARVGININRPEERGSGENDINTAVFSVRGKRSLKENSRNFKQLVEMFFISGMDVFGLKNFKIKSDDSFLGRITDDIKSLNSIIVLNDRKNGKELISEIIRDLHRKKCARLITGNFEKDNPEYTISFRKEGFSSASASPADAGNLFYNSVRGLKAASLDMGNEKDIDILVRLNNKYINTPEKIASLKIPLKEGLFDLSAFTEISYEENFRILSRKNRKPCFYLNVIPEEERKQEAKSVLIKYFPKGLRLPADEVSRKNKKEIIFLFTAALVFIYFFLGAQFESFIIPLFLMLSIPFSVSGAFIFLYAAGQSLNISSFLGILILSGTTVNTAIMIFAERKNNMLNIKKAALKRLLPASAAVLTTVSALLPAAIQINNPFQSSSAAALIGGLAAGSTAVLLIYPFLFAEKYSVPGTDSKNSEDKEAFKES